MKKIKEFLLEKIEFPGLVVLLVFTTFIFNIVVFITKGIN